MMGTPTYMAPEQCKGAGQVDQRADLYSLGCILFEMVCGRPPFVAEGAGEVMAAHIWAPPPMPSSIASVTPALEQLILCALAKEPARRFSSAEGMLAALQALAPSGSVMRTDASDAMATVAPRPVAGFPSGPGAIPPAWSVPGMPGAMVGRPAESALPSQTTMSAGAGVSVVPIRSGKKRSSIILLAALVTLGAGGGVFAVMQGSSKHEVPIAKSTATTGEPGGREPVPRPAGVAQKPPALSPPASPPPSSPPPTPKPTQATLSLSSEPAGAEVYRMP